MKGTQPGNSVERALAILELLAGTPSALSHARISRALHIPKSTASHILRCLESRAFVFREPGKGVYTLGSAVRALIRNRSAEPLEAAASATLQELASRVRLTAFLAVREGNQAVILVCREGPGPIRVETWPGQRVPLHTSAVGKALISLASEAELETCLGGGPVERLTTRTLTSREALKSELARVRAQGHAVDDEESVVGVRSVAAPITGGEGEAKAALGVVGTTIQITPATLPIVAGHVRAAARRLAERVVWTGE